MKVTIGIPVHNSEQWLYQCIQSALDQRAIEPEVIVVDDGSNDGSKFVIKEFGMDIQCHSTGGPKGANHARNLVLQYATGDWVQFLDADDYLEPAKIRTQLDESDQGVNADVLYSPVWIETYTETGGSRDLSRTCPAFDLPMQWIRWQIPQTGGALWRREALQRIGGWKPDQPCCQEHELYLRAIQAGLRFQFTPTPGAVYRIWSETTLCRKNPARTVSVRTGLMDKMLEWLAAEDLLTDDHRAEVGQACFEMSRTLARHDLNDAAKYHAERQSKGLIQLAGPAASTSYRMVYRTLGFKRAEQLAKAVR